STARAPDSPCAVQVFLWASTGLPPRDRIAVCRRPAPLAGHSGRLRGKAGILLPPTAPIGRLSPAASDSRRAPAARRAGQQPGAAIPRVRSGTSSHGRISGERLKAVGETSEEEEEKEEEEARAACREAAGARPAPAPPPAEAQREVRGGGAARAEFGWARGAGDLFCQGWRRAEGSRGRGKASQKGGLPLRRREGGSAVDGRGALS
ncbi:unnamed protein product, partial [Prorocentrum cordatum]